MGHLSHTRIESVCLSGTPGHLPAAPVTRPGLLADATGWVPVTVFIDLPAQMLTMACPSGARWRGHHHDVGELSATVSCSVPASEHDAGSRLQLVGAAACHWHPGARVLGLPADPRLSAGRTYVQLAPDPLEPCRLVHDVRLAAAFAAVTGTPVRR